MTFFEPYVIDIDVDELFMGDSSVTYSWHNVCMINVWPKTIELYLKVIGATTPCGKRNYFMKIIRG